jgi:HAE1 family hydrophobic/amphiphilic exporter-1
MQVTMIATLVLVVAVIFLFLHNGSATLIPALALPFSILGTFAVMQVMGFTLDNLSMMALILSIGFVVDDAIVMLENIVRHMELGESPLAASLAGSKEIGFTIVSMTVSLAACSSPSCSERHPGAALQGIRRDDHRRDSDFRVVSVTLTPMLCSRFLRERAPREGPFRRLWSGYSTPRTGPTSAACA